MKAVALSHPVGLRVDKKGPAPNLSGPSTPTSRRTVALLRRVIKAVVTQSEGKLALIDFVEGGRRLFAWCPDDETFTLCRELILERVYEQTPISLHDCAGTVVDAGAHVGIFSLQAARWAERVVSLEANGHNHAILQLNIVRNAIVNVDARHCALWVTSDALLDFHPAHHSGGGGVAEVAPGSEPEDRLDAVSLDDLVEELGTIDLLKIDIEGGEHAVLASSRRLDRVKRIVGEIHLDSEEDPRLEALENMLKAAGFATRIVSERELYGLRELTTLIGNLSSLHGHWKSKLIAACYLVAPFSKPIHRPGTAYSLPLLIAWRQVPPAVNRHP